MMIVLVIAATVATLDLVLLGIMALGNGDRDFEIQQLRERITTLERQTRDLKYNSNLYIGKSPEPITVNQAVTAILDKLGMELNRTCVQGPVIYVERKKGAAKKS